MDTDSPLDPALRRLVHARWAPLMGTLGKQPGRNTSCWCGSGKRYKLCHQQADADFRDSLRLPIGIEPGLRAIGGDLLEHAFRQPGRSLADRRQVALLVAHAAMQAWNLVRIKPDPKLLDALAVVASAFPGGMSEQVVELTARMAHRARWVQPGDGRLVRTIEVLDGPEGFTLRATALQPDQSR